VQRRELWDAIAANIKDPSWWFSTFSIAIVASVLAGFLKDKIERYLSGISENIKNWRAKSIAARKAIIDSLIEHPVFLNLAFYRAVLRILITCNDNAFIPFCAIIFANNTVNI
jgi:hypothetical protein